MLLQFRIGRIPVQVHFSHLLIAGLLGLTFATDSGTGRPIPALLAAWVVIVFVSVLVHELGHAVVALVFGYSPVIQLAGMGGNTRPNAPGPIPWWRDVLLTFAGPAFGLMLGLLCWTGYLFMRHEQGIAPTAVRAAAFINFFWAGMNLLPVTPLDGGRISTSVCTRLFGRVGFLLAQILGLLVSTAVVLAVMVAGQNYVFVALMFGWYGIISAQLIAAYLRGDAPTPATPDPRVQVLEQAATLYREGDFSGAQRKAEATLEGDLPPSLRARFHHLLGWVALKEGRGREALDHFAQVQGQRVEPHALAAGFSLVGDDARALPLWEHAARETKDKTLLHEWAGALLRLGRTADAERVPGVDLTAAYSCAERVLFIRGEFEHAARMGEAALALAPTAERAYDTACALARAGKPDDAVRLLERAGELGYNDPGYAAADDDLSSLRSHPGFRAWLGQLRHATP
jgi:Zn-dependent protease